MMRLIDRIDENKARDHVTRRPSPSQGAERGTHQLGGAPSRDSKVKDAKAPEGDGANQSAAWDHVTVSNKGPKGAFPDPPMKTRRQIT